MASCQQDTFTTSTTATPMHKHQRRMHSCTSSDQVTPHMQYSCTLLFGFEFWTVEGQARVFFVVPINVRNVRNVLCVHMGSVSIPMNRCRATARRIPTPPRVLSLNGDGSPRCWTFQPYLLVTNL
eukprot:358752-Chlamydomonas_euryale.AAC.25